MRIGHGYDAHRFQKGDAVVLGGVSIPFDRALAAHSDGDVLLHAICDSLLGASALGDIGRHFPDSNAEFKGADSRHLLREVARLIKHAGMSVINIDATLIAEHPKIAPHVYKMRANIGADLGIAVGQVSIKATTTEKMGFIGRGEGIAADAVALIQEQQ
ncbi:MAG TPA: 2-C-methyl-D-erythritol 2,4-cyclodiphosphate synthase [Gammaproteobacteria bacterium]|nr:2-C-methyl-D-erythritol 2,4-cyclodiphosphate synthase [Gammaproteobacteria bacterium]